MEMEAASWAGSALTTVLYAAISLPCAALLLVLGEAAVRVTSMALRGEKNWRPSRAAMLGYRVTRPVFDVDGAGQAYPSSAAVLPDDDDADEPPLLPAELLDRLAVAVYRRRGSGSAQQDPECAFCLAAVRDGEETRELRCRHVFHRACLDAWLVRPHAACPLCRARLLPPTTDTDYECLASSSPSPAAAALWHST